MINTCTLWLEYTVDGITVIKSIPGLSRPACKRYGAYYREKFPGVKLEAYENLNR